MKHVKTLEWVDPLLMACNVPSDEPFWVLLYSGQQYDFTGERSILALKKQKEVKGSSFDALSAELSATQHTFENAWFGYLGYGLKNQLENLPEDSPSVIRMPDMWMVQFSLIIVFDHDKKNVEVWADSPQLASYVPSLDSSKQTNIFSVDELASNMTKQQYLEKVKAIQDAIIRGDISQANLTRKFFGNITNDVRPIDLFTSLCAASPSPYSAFAKLDKHYVISSSPERFLHVDASGHVETRPIKGSMPRYENIEDDTRAKNQLKNSDKDKAENLMIVDLSRNDLSRGCITGSVKVDHLFGVTSYATVHHMASAVQGNKHQGVSTLELVKHCFPPGSMTGTPKIKAMQICSMLEKNARGIYSGAMGWFGGDGSADLSVVIRTIILHQRKFEFQVGGAIVTDSIAEKEWEETLAKARAIIKVLGISENQIANL